MRRIIISAIWVLVILATQADAWAQQQIPSYHAASPTLSPYLYLTRPNSGPFPNYQTFVQPLENQQTTNQIAQQQILQLQQTQQAQQTQFAPTTAPTGIGSTFNNVSHYYAGGANRVSAPRGKTAGATQHH